MAKDIRDNKALEIVLIVGCIAMSVLIFVRRQKVKAEAEAKLAEETVCEKIVCLSPAGAEILSAIGAEDKIVARTDFCDYPQSLSKLPSVGGFSGETLSAETILSYEPDLVYGASGMHDFLAEPLEAAGVKFYLSDASSFDAVYEEIKYAGSVTGHAEDADALCNKMQEEIKACAVKASGKERPSVYYEVWCVPYMSAGKKSFINEIISCAGGDNIFADLDENYPMVSEESIIAKNPKFILIPDMNGTSIEDVKARAGWETISAIENDKVVFINSDIFSRSGPRIVEAVTGLNEILFGE